MVTGIPGDDATISFERSMYFLCLIVLHRAVYASLCLLVGRWSVSNVASAGPSLPPSLQPRGQGTKRMPTFFFHFELPLLFGWDTVTLFWTRSTNVGRVPAT
jgi:hypothetical protein